MTREMLEHIRRWSAALAIRYEESCAPDSEPIRLKHAHSQRVALNCLKIEGAEHLGIPLLAEAAGLLHDVGRFPQYERYRNFQDSKSVNHGKLGARTIGEEGVLEGLAPGESEALLLAVKYHNASSAPELENPLAGQLLGILRDADKLDIWRVCADLYESPTERRLEIITNGIKDGPGYSKRILADIMAGRTARLSDMKVLNDFKLVNLSWISDLTYPASRRMAAQQGDLMRIAATLPRSPEVQETVNFLLNRLSA